MIRTEREYQAAKNRLEKERAEIEVHRRSLERLKLNAEQMKRAMGPLLSWHLGLAEEVEWYERVKKGTFQPSSDLAHIGRTLIAVRIASGWSQKDLARKLAVPESQVSRDERNEYHAVSVDRAQKILSAMGAQLKINVDLTQKRAA